jgi:predicted N-acetyltransferase YhbS
MIHDCTMCSDTDVHERWCPKVVGLLASIRGEQALAAQRLGNELSETNHDAARHLYAAAALLFQDAQWHEQVHLRAVRDHPSNG